jgi:hypothetical protein
MVVSVWLTIVLIFEFFCTMGSMVVKFMLIRTHLHISNIYISRHIHNQGTQKYDLMKKGLQRIILDFYYIYYFMIIVDWYMTITRMISC